MSMSFADTIPAKTPPLVMEPESPKDPRKRLNWLSKTSNRVCRQPSSTFDDRSQFAANAGAYTPSESLDSAENCRRALSPVEPRWDSSPLSPMDSSPLSPVQPRWGSSPSSPVEPRWDSSPLSPMDSSPLSPVQPRWDSSPSSPMEPRGGLSPSSHVEYRSFDWGGGLTGNEQKGHGLGTTQLEWGEDSPQTSYGSISGRSDGSAAFGLRPLSAVRPKRHADKRSEDDGKPCSASIHKLPQHGIKSSNNATDIRDDQSFTSTAKPQGSCRQDWYDFFDELDRQNQEHEQATERTRLQMRERMANNNGKTAMQAMLSNSSASGSKSKTACQKSLHRVKVRLAEIYGHSRASMSDPRLRGFYDQSEMPLSLKKLLQKTEIRITALSDDNDMLKDNVNALNNDNFKLKNTIAALRADNATLKEKYDFLDKHVEVIDRWNGCKFDRLTQRIKDAAGLAATESRGDHDAAMANENYFVNQIHALEIGLADISAAVRAQASNSAVNDNLNTLRKDVDAVVSKVLILQNAQTGKQGDGLADLRVQVNAVTDKISALDIALNSCVETMNHAADIVHVDDRFGNVDAAFDQLDQHIVGQTDRLDKLEAMERNADDQIKNLGDRLNKLEATENNTQAMIKDALKAAGTANEARLTVEKKGIDKYYDKPWFRDLERASVGLRNSLSVLSTSIGRGKDLCADSNEFSKFDRSIEILSDLLLKSMGNLISSPSADVEELRAIQKKHDQLRDIASAFRQMSENRRKLRRKEKPDSLEADYCALYGALRNLSSSVHSD